VRVNAQLIDARTNAHLWAQTYDRDLANVFAIQSKIAKAIADQLRAKPRLTRKASCAATTDLAFRPLQPGEVTSPDSKFQRDNDLDLQKAIELWMKR
jgi:hypothetical protein